MALLGFLDRPERAGPVDPRVAEFLNGFSIEVMPRTAEKIDDFREILPTGTRVYIAHIDGTAIEDMVATARRLSSDGFRVMPHFPARIIKDKATLEDWVARYQGEAGIEDALILAGSPASPAGSFESSMQLLESGAFDRADFKHLHVAGHPEGNRDIDPDGSTRNVDAAMHWKAAFNERTDAKMALVTQFAFEAGPIIEWANGLRDADIDLPVHVGIAGPAKLQTLIKFAIACGVGPSLKVLQRRARDVSKLLLPFEPDEVVKALARHKAAAPESAISCLHLFPLGGIKSAATWARTRSAIEPAILTA